LIASAVEGQLLEAIKCVRSGCEAALAEKASYNSLDFTDFQRRDRWVSCGLIDKLHAAVARHQQVAAWEADGSQPGSLQPELGRCFESIEKYLDIDLPAPWAPPDKARLVSDSVILGYGESSAPQWDGEQPEAVRAANADDSRPRSHEELFKQMIECAIRR